MELLIVFLVILLGVCAYVILNLYQKNNKYESSLEKLFEESQSRITDLENFIQQFSDNLSLIDKQLKEVDKNNWFENDDDVGYTFKTIKLITTQLQNFNVNYYAQEEKG